MFCPSPEGAVTVPHTPEKELLPFPNKRAIDTFPQKKLSTAQTPQEGAADALPYKGPPFLCSPSEGATAALSPHAQGGGDTQPPQTRASSDLAPLFRKSHCCSLSIRISCNLALLPHQVLSLPQDISTIETVSGPTPQNSGATDILCASYMLTRAAACSPTY